MMAETAFGFLGGDRRQLYAAKAAKAAGFPVYLCGFSQAETDWPDLPLPDFLTRCGAIVLPLPVTRDEKTLNAPFSGRKILLDDALAAALEGKRVFGGMTDRLRACAPGWKNVTVGDYYAREELIVGNAFLTAEGALAAAITETEGALCGSRCLVTGFGRIGKALCKMLSGLGARVDCCARKASDLAAIRALGCGALTYDRICDDYEVVFNTVPAQVLTAGVLQRLRPGTVLMELASPPGGIDLPAAQRMGLRVVSAQALPGRLSPRAAGELVWQTITNMMEE